MPNHLTPAEHSRLEEIRAAIALIEDQAKPLRKERDAIQTRARVRRHRSTD